LSTQRLSDAYKRYALGVVATVYMLNLLDRGLMGLLLQPIKEDLRLSDTQLGFLTGIAFGLFYAVLGLPIARWADRGNRVTIASMAIGLWGLTVMGCLFVASFTQLVFARVAAAVGEAGCKPPTYSLVGDYFPQPAERTRAMSIYWLGGALSSLISFIAGGWLNVRYGWRMTFFLMGIPGLLMALLVKLTLVEPRTRLGSGHGWQGAALPLRTVLAVLWRRRGCRHLALALILFFTMSFGLTPWTAVFMIRSHAMNTAELGTWLGLISGLGGAVSILVGGYVSSRWFVGNERGQMRLSAVMLIATVAFFVPFLMLPQKNLALVMLIPWTLVVYFFVAPTYALMQRLVPDEMRATTMAVIMLLYNLIGMGLGPQLVGITSDVLKPVAGGDSLRYAMLIMSLVTLWSAYHFWQVGRTVEEDLLAVAEVRSVATEPDNMHAEIAIGQKARPIQYDPLMGQLT
jgi:MFS family permease